MTLSRRAFGLALLACGLMPGRAAEAALRPPLYEPPTRGRPLGTWGLIDRRPVAEPATTVVINLTFKSAIPVESPVLRFWRTSSTLPIPVTEQSPLDGDPMLAGNMNRVAISIDIPARINPGAYRIYCEMVDPSSRRRAQYSFLLFVVAPG